MLGYLEDAPPKIVLEKIYEEFSMDTGIYATLAAKPSVVGVPYLLNVWKRGRTELPASPPRLRPSMPASIRRRPLPRRQ